MKYFLFIKVSDEKTLQMVYVSFAISDIQKKQSFLLSEVIQILEYGKSIASMLAYFI